MSKTLEQKILDAIKDIYGWEDEEIYNADMLLHAIIPLIQNHQQPELLDLLNDDALAERVALDCHDPAHDSRWCGTCETRSAAIDNYQQAVLAEYNKQNGTNKMIAQYDNDLQTILAKLDEKRSGVEAAISQSELPDSDKFCCNCNHEDLYPIDQLCINCKDIYSRPNWQPIQKVS